jgi:hypothetical protein
MVVRKTFFYYHSVQGQMSSVVGGMKKILDEDKGVSKRGRRFCC